MTVQLDTSGEVPAALDAPHLDSMPERIAWENLDAFTQGYVEAMAQAASLLAVKGFDGIDGEEVPRMVAFADLAPETLARIISDCATFEPEPTVIVNHEYGRSFWRVRQEGRLPKFPALVVSLGADGKVRFA